MYEEKETEESEKPVSNGLDQAAEISFDEADSLAEDYMNFLAKGLTENKPRPIGPHWFCEYAKNRFIAGAKWAREQMMNEAVEVRVQASPLNGPLGISAYCCNFPSKHPFYHCKEGDKVRVIVIKKED